MNEALKMQISAFVDGELPDNEAELLLRRLSQDVALRNQVARYLAIGRLIRKDRELPGMDRLRTRILSALGEESLPEAEMPSAVGARFMTPTTGIAVAAVVAAVALIGLSQISGPAATGLQEAAVAIDLAPTYTEPPAAEALANSPSPRLRELHRRHSDSAAVQGSGDILLRMATYQVDEGDWVKIEPDPRLLGVEDNDTPDDKTSSK